MTPIHDPLILTKDVYKRQILVLGLKKIRKTMIDMSKIHSIRQMQMERDSIAHISKALSISQPATYKPLEKENLPVQPHPLRQAMHAAD